MESLAYTYSVLAWEEDTPALRKVNWLGATSALAAIAAVHSGVAYGNELSIPQSFESPDYTQFVSEFSREIESDYSASTLAEIATPEVLARENWSPQPMPENFSKAIAGEITPPETIESDLMVQKQTKARAPKISQSVASENLEIAKTAGTYPRPYYSRTKIPEEQKITPFNLVHRAYSGGFRDSGIPGYSTLIQSTKSGKVDARDLIRAGIIQGRLTNRDLYDPSYLSAVRAHLKDLGL
ncbi:MAG: hypothetical protein J7647_09940 [Cyanobacteria bacterium SBLK]|nr:hypothetical protein [Cyanobacteria bacterium SBLK]